MINLESLIGKTLVLESGKKVGIEKAELMLEQPGVIINGNLIVISLDDAFKFAKAASTPEKE